MLYIEFSVQTPEGPRKWLVAPNYSPGEHNVADVQMHVRATAPFVQVLAPQQLAPTGITVRVRSEGALKTTAVELLAPAHARKYVAELPCLGARDLCRQLQRALYTLYHGQTSPVPASPAVSHPATPVADVGRAFSSPNMLLREAEHLIRRIVVRYNELGDEWVNVRGWDELMDRMERWLDAIDWTHDEAEGIQ